MAGRPRKTEAEHRLHGTVSQAKPVTASPIVGGRPKFPKHLSIVARKEFKRVCGLLEARGVLTPGDEALIALHAEVYSRWISAKEEMGSRLMIRITVMDNNGEPHEKDVLHPLLKVAQACETRLQALAKELSLTPLARDKARITSESKDREVVPGSLAETNPELFDANGRLKLLTMPSAADLASHAAEEEEEEGEK